MDHLIFIAHSLNKMAAVCSRFASVSGSEIPRIHKDAVPENTKKAMKFSLSVFKG